MKICVLGLDSASPDIVFNDERLNNLRRLMELGTYGKLQSVSPPSTVPGWVSLVTSQDPGSLGMYGSQEGAGTPCDYGQRVSCNAIKNYTIWDHLASQNQKSILVGMPPNWPPQGVNGISVGSLNGSPRGEFVHPSDLSSKILEILGEHSDDTRNEGGEPKARLRNEIITTAKKSWDVVRWLLSEQDWGYFHYVDIGLNRLQRTFWGDFDKQHARYQPGNPYENVIPDYYLFLDEQIGSILELLDNDTALLVVSCNGVQRLQGSFAVNQWLRQLGLLELNDSPTQAATCLTDLDVNWGKTRVWAEGGSCARLFFNVQGRNPSGLISPMEYSAFQDDVKRKLQALQDDKGQPMNCVVLKPEEIYCQVQGMPPDLLVYFGHLSWRAVESVGHSSFYVDSDSTDCNASPDGMFVLTAPNSPLRDEYTGASVLDMAPTLLDLAGYEIPKSMQGRSLVAGLEKNTPAEPDAADADQIILDRLAGLGYV